MRAVRSTPPGVTVVEVDEPEEPDDLIRIRSAGICASDLMYIRMGFDRVLGDEMAGVTTDVTAVARCLSSRDRDHPRGQPNEPEEWSPK